MEAIVKDISDDDGWAFLGAVGNLLNKRYPDFDSRNYGYPKLSQLVESLKQFDIDRRPTSNPHIRHAFIRLKPKKGRKAAAGAKSMKKNWRRSFPPPCAFCFPAIPIITVTGVSRQS